MLHKTSRERYDKIKKLFHRLMKNFNVDDLDDFILTVNSMPEWMRHDTALVQEQKDAIARFTVPESWDWQICNQIANRQKHVKPQRQGGQQLRVNSVDVKSDGQGVLLPSVMRVFGAGQEIFIDYGDTKESALGFVVRTFRHFHYMFEVAPVPVPQRQIPNFEDLLNI